MSEECLLRDYRIVSIYTTAGPRTPPSSLRAQILIGSSLRADGSRERAPDDRLREAIHIAACSTMDCFVASLLGRKWVSSNVRSRSSCQEYSLIFIQGGSAPPSPVQTRNDSAWATAISPRAPRS